MYAITAPRDLNSLISRYIGPTDTSWQPKQSLQMHDMIGQQREQSNNTTKSRWAVLSEVADGDLLGDYNLSLKDIPHGIVDWSKGTCSDETSRALR